MADATSFRELKQRFLTKAANLAGAQDDTRRRMIEKYGSAENFRAALRLTAIEDPFYSRFTEVYDFYATFFPLPDERETLDGFRRAMSFNFSDEHQQRLSPFSEGWLVADTPEGELIAGVNFSVYAMPEAVARRHSIEGTANIIYIFVREEFRNLGVAGFLLAEMDRHFARWIEANRTCAIPGARIPVMCEQNAPELMTPAQYFSDCLYAGIDQCDRLVWWHHKGYRRLAFNYIQPALSVDGEPCRELTFNLRAGDDPSGIPGEVLWEHLRRYYEISVFKGRWPDWDDYLHRLEEFLLSTPQIGTTGDAAYYAALKERCYAGDFVPETALFDLP